MHFLFFLCFGSIHSLIKTICRILESYSVMFKTQVSKTRKWDNHRPTHGTQERMNTEKEIDKLTQKIEKSIKSNSHFLSTMNEKKIESPHAENSEIVLNILDML